MRDVLPHDACFKEEALRHLEPRPQLIQQADHWIVHLPGQQLEEWLPLLCSSATQEGHGGTQRGDRGRRLLSEACVQLAAGVSVGGGRREERM